MHDYARSVQRNKQSQKKKPQKAALPKWLIPLTLLLVAALVFGLYKLTRVPPAELPAKTEAPAQKKESKPKTVTKPREVKEDYDFYNLLPESEVIAPKVEEYSTKKADATGKQYTYMLQAGSFRSAAEADRLRAKLLLEGLTVNTSKVTNQNGDVWHRVIVGPFSSRSKLNRAQDILANNNTDSMLIKVER
jgi:cell division protein FtsN